MMFEIAIMPAKMIFSNKATKSIAENVWKILYRDNKGHQAEATKNPET